MIYWDTTKTGKKNYPASGIKRVSDRMVDELQKSGQNVILVKWDKRLKTFNSRSDRYPISNEGLFITPEIFEEHDRPGFMTWAKEFRGYKVAIFHDVIPIRFPQITWPDSVARHPHYMKLIGIAFNQVLAVSKASEVDLLGYWKWLQIENMPLTGNLQWGADYDGMQRNKSKYSVSRPLQLLQVGILEPRKNQNLTLNACETLWKQGLDFHLHIAGRKNQHFGAPVVDRIRELRKAGHHVFWHKAPNETELRKLYANTHLCLFPSLAEGCGLPVIESLWEGRPVLASNLPCIQENANYGGVEIFDIEDPSSLTDKLHKLLTHPNSLETLAEKAQTAELPTWEDAATELLRKTSR